MNRSSIRSRPGQAARIIVDALPNEELFGVVRQVQPLPDAGAFGSPNVKLYTAMVEIVKGSRAIRPGMTAKVEILIKDLDDVITVPLKAVRRFGGKYHVAVKAPEGGFAWREVTMGAQDDKVVQVKQGLKDGEQVAEDATTLAAPPDGASGRP